MDGIKYAVFTEKSHHFLGKNQYTFNGESVFTKTEIKHWVELFFGVKVVAVNSHRLPGKGRRMGLNSSSCSKESKRSVINGIPCRLSVKYSFGRGLPNTS